MDPEKFRVEGFRVVRAESTGRLKNGSDQDKQNMYH